MGSIGSALFGHPSKSSSTTTEGNNAYPAISSALSPALNYTTQAGGLLGNMLGVGGAPAQTDALNNFANSGGMKFLQQQGMDGIASNNAAKGLLQSGSTLKSMDQFNQNTASTYLGQYMSSLLGLGNLGVSAGNVLSDSGRYMNASSSGTGQKEGLMQMMASNAASAAKAASAG